MPLSSNVWLRQVTQGEASACRVAKLGDIRGWATGAFRVAVFGWALSFCCVAGAAVTGDLDALKLVADLYRANQARLITWSGQAHFVYVYKQSGDGKESTAIEGDVSFLLDVPAGKLRCAYEYDLPSEVAKSGQRATSLNSLVADNRLTTVYRYSSAAEKQPTIQISAVKNIEAASSGECFNPLRWFGCRSEDIATRFMFYFDNASNPELSGDITVERQGNEVVVTTVVDELEYLEKYTVDLERGGNLVRFELNNSGRRTLIEWSHEKRDGVWIPKTYKRTASTIGKTADKDANAVVSKEVQAIDWTENVINERFDESEFTMAKLGIEEGDIVRDHLTGSFYEYNTVGDTSID